MTIKRYFLCFLTTLSMASQVCAAPLSLEGELFSQEQEKHAQSIQLMEQLGIMTPTDEGFTEGNYLTRAGAAVLMTRLSNLEHMVSNNTVSSFEDVPTSHHASGYINLASDIGIISGVGDGLFEPDKPVIWNEMLTFVVRTLGYQTMAENDGGYPFGYISTAYRLGINKNVQAWSSPYITKGEVAKILENVLEVNLLAVSYQSGVAQYSISNDPSNTVLYNYLKLEKLPVKIVKHSKNDDEVNRVVVNILDKNKMNVIGTGSYELSPLVSESVKSNAITGTIADVYVDRDGVIKAIVKESIVFYSYIKDINDFAKKGYVHASGSVTMVTLNSTNITYKASETIEVTLDKKQISNPVDLISCFAKVIINKDNEVVSIEASTFNPSNAAYIERTWGIIEKVNKGRLIYRDHEYEGTEMPGFTDVTDMLILLDGVEVTLNDLKEDMFFDYIYDSEDESAVLLVSSVQLFDHISEHTATTITVDEIVYDISNHSFHLSLDSGFTYQNNLENLVTGKDAYIKLDSKGDVRMIETDASIRDSGFYGIVVDVRQNPLEDEVVTVVRDVKGSGRKATYSVNLKSTVPSRPGNPVRSYEQLLEIINNRTAGGTQSEQLQNLTTSLVFWFGLNGGVIREIIRPNWITYDSGDYLFRGYDLLHELPTEYYTWSKVRDTSDGISGKSLEVTKNFTIRNPADSGNFGRKTENNFRAQMRDDTKILCLYDSFGNFEPHFISHDDFLRRNLNGTSVMIEGDDVVDIYSNDSSEREGLTRLIVICEGINSMLYRSDEYAGTAYVDSSRKQALMYDEDGETREYTKLNFTGRFGGEGNLGKYEVFLREGYRVYDLFQFNVEDSDSSTGSGPFRLKTGGGSRAQTKSDRANPNFSNYFLDFKKVEQVGANTIITVKGFDTNNISTESQKNANITEAFNLDKLTPPGEVLGRDYPHLVGTIYDIVDGRLFYTSDTDFRSLSKRMLILEYDPSNERNPYTVREPKYITRGSRVFFLYAETSSNNGAGELRAVVYQK